MWHNQEIMVGWKDSVTTEEEFEDKANKVQASHEPPFHPHCQAALEEGKRLLSANTPSHVINLDEVCVTGLGQHRAVLAEPYVTSPSGEIPNLDYITNKVMAKLDDMGYECYDKFMTFKKIIMNYRPKPSTIRDNSSGIYGVYIYENSIKMDFKPYGFFKGEESVDVDKFLIGIPHPFYLNRSL
jgi:hypothetical protein